MIKRLGAWTFRHRRTTVIAWLVALVGFGTLGNVIVGSSFSSAFDIPASESASGFDVISEFFPQQGAGRQSGSIVFRAEEGVAQPVVRSRMTEFLGEVDAIEGVTVLSPYDEGGERQIDPSGTIAFATLNLDDALDRAELSEIGTEVENMVPVVDGVMVEVGGQALAEFEPPQSELIGLGFAIVVLILAFGSVLAMGLPIGVALFGVGVGVGVVALFSNLVTIPDFATTLGAMIGIAVGIDYALFIVTRYRESLKRGQSFEEAAVTAMDTAGRAVVFAGVTVVVSLLGMLLIGLEFISGLGIGAATTVAVTMIASITLLPALLSFAGDRIEVTRWRGIIAAGFVALTLFGVGVDGAVDDDGRALAGVLVDDVEQLEGAAVDGRVELEVHRPQGVRSDRAHRSDMGTDAGEALLAALVGHLQALVAPQPADPLVVDLPAAPAGVLGGASPSPAWSPPGEVPQELTQALLVVNNDGRVQALGGAVLSDHPTRSTLGDPEPFPQHLDGAAATGRGQKFPSASSLSIDLSSSASASSFFSRAFSPSSSRSRFASLAFMPPYWASQRCHVDSATSRCRHTSSNDCPPASCLWPSASLRMI